MRRRHLPVVPPRRVADVRRACAVRVEDRVAELGDVVSGADGLDRMVRAREDQFSRRIDDDGGRASGHGRDDGLRDDAVGLVVGATSPIAPVASIHPPLAPEPPLAASRVLEAELHLALLESESRLLEGDKAAEVGVVRGVL